MAFSPGLCCAELTQAFAGELTGSLQARASGSCAKNQLRAEVFGGSETSGVSFWGQVGSGMGLKVKSEGLHLASFFPEAPPPSSLSVRSSQQKDHDHQTIKAL